MRILSGILTMFFIIAFQPLIMGQWQLTGNNNATTTSLLGTTNSVPLRVATKNTVRMTIDTFGRIGIGTSTPVNLLTVKGAGSNPVSTWANAGAPLFVGFGETTVGNADFILGMGAAAANARPVFIGRKSRGTLAAPAVVANNDYMMSFLSSGYDGSSFQNPAAIDFYVDGTPSSGNVPARISFVTGSNSSNRAERLKIGNTGDFAFNGTQLTLSRSTGNLSVGNGNFSVAKNTNLKGLVGINGDTLAGTALYINANATVDGIKVNDAVNKIALYTQKSGLNTAIHVIKTSAASTTGCIIGQSTASSTGIEGYSVNNYGLYGNSDSSVAIAGIGTTGIGILGETGNPTSYAGYFNGDLFTTGTYTSSDEKLKSNVSDFGNALQIISALQPKNYNFKSEGNYAALHLPKGTHYGFIAHELEKVLPSLVKETPLQVNGYKKSINEEEDFLNNKIVNFKAVNYTELIPIMVKGMQELSDQNETLKQTNEQLKIKLENVEKQSLTISALQQQVNELMAILKGNTAIQNKTVTDNKQPLSSEFSLSQNVPNPPVNHSTRIWYTLPALTQNALLVLTDVNSKKINEYKLVNSSKGSVVIQTDGLAAGSYFYTLYANGKRLETKQLVIAEK